MLSVKIKKGNKDIKIVNANKGDNLLQILRREGIDIESPCGGRGFCGKCKVKIVEGEKARSNYRPDEAGYLSVVERSAGIRLACRVEIEEDLVVEVLNMEYTDANILTEGEGRFLLDPLVKKEYLKLDGPSVDDQASDVERIENALHLKAKINTTLMKDLPDVLRSSDFNVTAALFDREIISIERGDTSRNKYGLAVDIGTTTMVGFLMDLNTGQQVGVYSALNPQRPYGADVISRIDYTIENPEGLKQLSNLVRSEINNMLEYFRKEYSVCPDNIYHVVVVGNTVMMHIFAGLTVSNIAVSPFIPVVTRKIEFSATELGINICPGGRVTILPMVSGYVGADTIGAILACDMADKDEVSLMVDIGTNGEIALGNREKMLACSTAAGPAFEGAHIRHGLGGVQGAINKVRIEDEVFYTTIGGGPARGICGSGIVDITAQMLKRGILESTGRMRSREELKGEIPDTLHSRVRVLDGKPALLIASKDEGAAEDIYFCQKDVREVQLAKAAIAAGIRVLMKRMEVTFADISNVYLAGGFGNYIDYDHAADIGLIPEELRSKIVPIGNGAGIGAKMALLSKDCLKKAEDIRKKVEYMELSTLPEFQTAFVDLMEF